MGFRGIGVLLVAAGVAGPAVSQTAGQEGSPFTLSGRVVLDTMHMPLTPYRTHGLIDLDLSVAPGAAGLPDGVGLEFGLYHYRDNAIPFTGTAGFAALTFDLGGGRLAVGAPRIAADGLRRAPLPGGMEAGLHTVHMTVGGLPMATLIQSSDGAPFWGLRYDTASGPFDWSVSATRSSGPTASPNLAVGLSGALGPVQVYASGEAFQDGAGWGSTLVLGGQMPVGPEGQAGSLTLGAEFARIGSGGFAFESVIGYGTVALSERLSVTASVLHIAGPVFTSDTLAGVAIGYDLWRGVRLNAGAVRTATSPFTLYSLGLSRAF